MPKVSEEHMAAVRDRLIDAAARVMARGGPEAATTRAIVAEAEVSAGTLYNHFPAKAELFAAVGERLLFSDWSEMVAQLDPELPDGGIRALVDSTVINRDGDLTAQAAGVLLRHQIVSSDDERDAQRRYNRFVVDTVAPAAVGCQQLGVIDADIDAEAAVELLDMVADAIVIRDAQSSWATDRDRVTALLEGVLEQVVYSSETCAPISTAPINTVPINRDEEVSS